MAKFQLNIVCDTEDELQGIVNRLTGVDDAAAAAEAPKTTKKTPTKKAEEATEEEAAPPKKPAPVKKKKKSAKAKVPSVEELKAKIIECVGGDLKAEGASERVSEFVKSFGVDKISEFSDEQRTRAMAEAEEFFSQEDEEEDEEEDEDDPMA